MGQALSVPLTSWPPPSHLNPATFASAQHLRDELALHARSQCKGAMAAFAECAKQHGMMVVLKCRGLNRQSELVAARAWVPMTETS